MKLILKGEAKEIASLVLTLQGRQERAIQITGIPETKKDRAHLASVINDILASQYQVHSSKQQPDPTSREQTKDEEYRLDEPDP